MIIYQRVQQSIIDVLDKGEYVKILGKGKNHTDLMVKLHPLEMGIKKLTLKTA